jgi:hypothetical protein
MVTRSDADEDDKDIGDQDGWKRREVDEGGRRRVCVLLIKKVTLNQLLLSLELCST